MKRIVTTAMALSMLTLAAPGMASAHGDRHHHRAHHAGAPARHARHVRLLAIGATTTPQRHDERLLHDAGKSDLPTAGTVTSYTNGLLTITLNDGTTVISGQVNENTEIGCRPATPPPTPGSDQDGDEQGGAEGGGAWQGHDQQNGDHHDESQGGDGNTKKAARRPRSSKARSSAGPSSG